MSYRVKRIDPYWIKNPVLPVVAVVAALAALLLIARGLVFPALGAAIVAGLAVLLSVQPAVSAALGALGLVGGLLTFILVPNSQNAAMSVPLRILATIIFGLLYTVLMSGVVLLFAAFYNLFAGAIGLGGLGLDLEAEGGEGGA